MASFERELYRDPDRELNGVWWDLVERYQSLTRPENRVEGSGYADWAAKIHFSVSPVYYQNYLLGEIAASQLQAHLFDLVGGGEDVWDRYVTSPEVGRFLNDRVYRIGCTLDWRATIEHATGRSLDPEPFLAELRGDA
jgi:peptidyl-dipeptidase A